MTAPRPLSYWVRAVDELLDEQFAQSAEEAGLTRREWQLLNRLRVGAVADDALDAAIGPFLDDGEDLADPVRRLTDDGLLEHQGSEYRLTDKGVQRVDDVQDEAVRRISDRATSGLGEDGYRQLVDSLERVAHDLGWSPI